MMTKHTITSAAVTADELYHDHANNRIPEQTNAVELQQDADAYFPLQPIEKKLCTVSFGLGIVLLACFVLAFE